MRWLERLADLVARERFDITRLWTQEAYLTRWTLLGKRSDGKYATYLHRFHRSDADEMHNHPWPFVSVILAGGYWEQTPGPGWSNGDGPTRRRWYGPGRVLVRPANWIHSVLIPEGRESWSLIFRGVKCQSWGFFCPRTGFINWRDHHAKTEQTGSGCAA